MYITKRSGEKELFNRKKITEAIRKAFDSIDYTVDDSVLDELANSIHVWDDITIDEFSSMVE